MSRKARKDVAFWTGCGAVLLFVLVLGLRCGQTVSAVLSARGQPTPEAKAAGGTGTADAFEIARRDSLVAAATPGERNPFRDPPPRERAPTRRPETPRPVSEPPPSLRALLYDTVNPSVQLAVGNSASGWLLEGDVFKGWTVAAITPTSVTVTRGNRSLVLNSE